MTQDYPEHEKLRAVKAQSQACGDFLTGLKEKGWSLGRWDEKGEEPLPDHTPTERLLAQHFDVDLEKLEAEKRQMLVEISERPLPLYSKLSD